MTGGSNADSVSSWLELESDPGLFTLLVDDLGVKGVQVEEIYDLSKTLENSIFGFIFLFKWMERRNRRSKAAALDPKSNYVTDPNIVNKIFFAHQIAPNSCATHALLSILLNCKSNKYFNLGELLTKFQRVCDGLTPENKGFAIGNQSKLAEAHNSYAKPEKNRQNQSFTARTSRSQINDSAQFATSSSTASSSMNSSHLSSSSNSTGFSNTSTLSSGTASNNEIFHFICFVPINGRLYELDGLKPFPIDHGPLITDADLATNISNNWTNKFKHIIRQRLTNFNSGQQNHEIRFNLMAVVPDKMPQLHEQIELMKANITSIQNLLGEFQHQCLSENDLNVKNELLLNVNIKNVKIDLTKSSDLSFVKKENDLLSPSSSSSSSSSFSLDTVQIKADSTTRQLRSNRATTNQLHNFTHRDDATKSELFQFEITFSLQNESTSERGNSLKLKKIAQLDEMLEFCKLYKIESIKYFSSICNPSTALQIVCKKQKLADGSLTDSSNDLKEKENEIINKIKSQLSKSTCVKHEFKFDAVRDNVFTFNKLTELTSLKLAETRLQNEIQMEEAKYNEEIEKRRKYRTDALRRKHVYDEFIATYLKILSENGKLAEIIRSNGYLAPGNSSHSSNENGSTLGPLFLQQPTSKKRKK